MWKKIMQDDDLASKWKKSNNVKILEKKSCIKFCFLGTPKNF